MQYKINDSIIFDVGFPLTSEQVTQAILLTNLELSKLPEILYQTMDYKSTSGLVGAFMARHIASVSGSIVNPIEKGHPDIVPADAVGASEEALRHYPTGLEIKVTAGNLKNGTYIPAGQSRISNLASLTWQAHHREVDGLMGCVWDFLQEEEGKDFLKPVVTAVFYSDDLNEDDWGAISGTTGRNTKVSGMTGSGKQKMGQNWISIVDIDVYKNRYERILKFSTT